MPSTEEGGDERFNALPSLMVRPSGYVDIMTFPRKSSSFSTSLAAIFLQHSNKIGDKTSCISRRAASLSLRLGMGACSMKPDKGKALLQNVEHLTDAVTDVRSGLLDAVVSHNTQS